MMGVVNMNSVLHVLTLQLYLVRGQIEWKTVLLATQSSGANIVSDLFQKWGQSINKDATTNEMDSVFNIAQRGTFRSPLIDNWAVENHTYVRLGIFNSRGGLLWWLTFDGFLSDHTNWNRASRIKDASHKSLMDNPFETTINFDSNGVSVTMADKGWMWVFQKGGVTRMLFSMRVAKTFPGVDYVLESNSATVIARKDTPSDSFSFLLKNYMFWMGLFAKTYIIGFGIRKAAGGELTEFMLSYSVNDSCFSNLQTTQWDFYRDSSGLPMTITPTYDASGRFYLDSSSMLTTYGKCWRIQVKQTTGSTATKAYVYTYHAQGDFLEGDILAIQWGQDPQVVDPLQDVVNKIHQSLAYDKYESARYKSQFTSSTDLRPSAVMFGVLGLCIFLLIVTGIVLLDVATLRRQLKFAKRNTAEFRQKVKEKWRSFKARTVATFARAKAALTSGRNGETNMAAASSASGQSGTSKGKPAAKKENAKAGTSKVKVNSVNSKHGSSVASGGGASNSLRSQSSVSKNKAGTSTRKKPLAVLTQISE